jgi:hypothetical protein
MRLFALRDAALLCAAFLLGAGSANAQANGGAFITNGTVQLGVNRDGSLNVGGGPRSSGKPISTTIVGLRYVPTGAEGTADGCLCEGWGAADKLSRREGGANQTFHGANGFNLTLESFTATSSTATSRVRINNTFRVTHNYRPSLSPNLYQVDVTIENISSSTSEVLYRRANDWDIEPTPFAEFITIVTKNPTTGQYPKDLIFSSDNGFVNSRVLSAAGSQRFVGGPTGADQTDSGPSDHGAVFDFNFGSLPPGATKAFRIFYGAAGNEADALTAIAAVGAELYSLGQPSVTGGATFGTPNTFILAFAGVGGTPIIPATATTTTLSVSSIDTTFGAPVTMTAIVEAAEGSVAPAGTVQFRDRATVLHTATLNPVPGTVQSTASFTTAAFAAGERSITAVYGGGSTENVRFRVSESAAVPIFVAKARPVVTVTGGIFRYDGLPHAAEATVRGIDGAPLGPVSVTYNGSTAVPVGAGSYAVTVSYAGDANYESVFDTSASIVVEKAPLTITANDAARILGESIPAFSARYAGFVLGETPAQLEGSLTFTTSARPASGVGTYPVVVSGVSSPNYAISFIDGTLTVAYNVCTLYDAARSHRSGSTIPLKLQLCDINGANVSSAAIEVIATSLTQSSAAVWLAVDDAGHSNPGARFRYDEALNGYILNLKTIGLSTGPYRLVFSAGGDPTAHVAQFQVR